MFLFQGLIVIGVVSYWSLVLVDAIMYDIKVFKNRRKDKKV